MPLPTTAREELEGRIQVLERDAREARDDAARQRTVASNYDRRADEYDARAAELGDILARAFPKA